MSKYFTPALQALDPYTPGEQPQDQKYIKLNTNESPFPPSPWVVEAVNTDEVNNLRLYSDPTVAKLCDAIAAHNGLQRENIICGNGSDEILSFAIRAFCDENTPLAFADITYGFYKVWCKLWGVPGKVIPLKEDFSIDPNDYKADDATIIIANPNAPTGKMLSRTTIEEILKCNHRHVVIVDEAYVDFGGESCVPLIERYSNLLVVQTYSKSRNLAGARLGFALGSKELIADLNRIKYSYNPYNVNRITTAAGIASMLDVDYFKKCTGAIIKNRAWTTEQLRALGLEVIDSKTNFVFARKPGMSGADLYLALKNRGILVRHFDAPRISDWLRITIGSETEMQAFINTVREILNTTEKE